MVLPFVNADLIMPGIKNIPIENKITNINAFPDYVFIEVGKLGGLSYSDMCDIKKITDDGILSGRHYKFCDISVYAVKKTDFDDSILDRENGTKVNNFINSSKAVEVLEGLSDDYSVPVTSTQKSSTNYYTIDLSKVKSKPDKTVIERDWRFYLYIIIPIIALAIITYILVKRRKW